MDLCVEVVCGRAGALNLDKVSCDCAGAATQICSPSVTFGLTAGLYSGSLSRGRATVFSPCCKCFN